MTAKDDTANVTTHDTANCTRASVAERAGQVARRTARTANEGAHATGRAVAAAPSKAAAAAGAGWAQVKERRNRKAVAAGGGAGLAVIGGAVLLLVRRARRPRTLLGRLTRGRLGR